MLCSSAVAVPRALLTPAQSLETSSTSASLTQFCTKWALASSIGHLHHHRSRLKGSEIQTQLPVCPPSFQLILTGSTFFFLLQLHVHFSSQLFPCCPQIQQQTRWSTDSLARVHTYISSNTYTKSLFQHYLQCSDSLIMP